MRRSARCCCYGRSGKRYRRVCYSFGFLLVNESVRLRPMRIFLTLFLLGAFCYVPAQTSQPALNLMPLPSNYQLGSGQLSIDQSFSVTLAGHKEARLERAVQRFLELLSRRTGMPLANRSVVNDSNARFTITTEHASKPVQEAGEDESYALEINASAARL